MSAFCDWLECGSWVAAVKLSLVATSSLVDSLLSVAKVSKTRYTLKVIFGTLEILFKRKHHAEAPSETFEALEK